MATDTNVSQLIINELTQDQYIEAKDAGQVVETELYLIKDGDGVDSVNGKTGAVQLTASDVGAATTSAVEAAQTTANEAKTAVNNKASTVTYTVSVPASWGENIAGGYMQTVTVNGMLATDNPIADVILGADVEANVAYMAAWACVTRITTAANSITLYANGEAPATAFTMQLKAVR